MSYPLTIVSGYWLVMNKHDLRYLLWFENTLKINCPYIFFGNDETIEIVKEFRGELPTHYVRCELEEFYTYKYKDRISTDFYDCPSVELNMIWNEKIFLLEKACAINPFKSEFFSWVDAGICLYRDEPPPTRPFPDLNKLALLPKDKFIFTSSQKSDYEPSLLNTYYHHVSGTYLLHKNIIPQVINLYKEYIEKLLNLDNISTDQVILTHIYNDHPSIFFKLGHGYGELLSILY
jgi:hypothetical protein